MKTFLPFFSFLIITFCSCYSVKHTGSSDSLFFSDANKVWKLNSMEGSSPAANEKQIPSITFSKKEKRAYGTGGCNRFSGSFSLNGKNSIEFGPMVSTRMACLNMQNEDRFFKLLSAVKTYTVKRQHLILAGSFEGKDFQLTFSAVSLMKD
jgi:heat shock protein HslJ